MNTNKHSVKDLLADNATIVILVVLCLIVTILRPKFITPDNIMNVLSAATVTGCMALGMTFVIISGGIDLAAGAEVAFAGVLGASFGQTATAAAGKVFDGLPQLPFIIPVLVSVAAAVLIGALNGFLISHFNTPPFIVTLGMKTVLRGATLLITGGEPVSNLTPGYTALGSNIFHIVPVSVLVFAVLIIISSVILRMTKFGKDVYAIGSNERAASVSGVKVPFRKCMLYGYAGLMYAIAGLIIAARASSIHPGAAEGYELIAIASCVIGGASPSGGTGSIRTTVIGALIISVLRNGLTLLGIESNWQQIAVGLVIVVACAFDVRRNSSR
ncbi:MAG: ABC transporter permease [Lachnospiraceae bacterium]|nr:ABC transporter permease [Lachnospiraceae bacterium]